MLHHTKECCKKRDAFLSILQSQLGFLQFRGVQGGQCWSVTQYANAPLKNLSLIKQIEKTIKRIVNKYFYMTDPTLSQAHNNFFTVSRLPCDNQNESFRGVP